MKHLAAALLLTACPAIAQEAHLPPHLALEFAPPGVRILAQAADSILSSGASGQISLEAFDAGIATGVYLYGSYRGAVKSVGYGRDPLDRRYMWLSLQGVDSIDYMAMLYDVDHDLRPDFMLLRVADWSRRIESSTEFRSPAARETPFDITIMPACALPRCDPATWTVRDRARQEVPAYWFEGWRPILALAAMRGERWLGRPVAALPSAPPRNP